MTDEPSPAESTTVQVAAAVLKAAADDPKMRQAGSNVAQTLVVLTETVKNCVMPLAVVNYAIASARDYFTSGRFEQELTAKAARIPPECIVEPKASVAGPALQGLTFAHDEPVLKDMFLSLLASAMDGRDTDLAHPAFVEAIKQLTAFEATLLRDLMSIMDRESSNSVPAAELRIKDAEDPSGYQIAFSHLLPLMSGGQPRPVTNITAIVENWIRLGFVSVTYVQFLVGDTKYDWVTSRPEFIEYAASLNPRYSLEPQPGVLIVTAFGQRFGKAVGIAT